jgi:sulfatase modifying factor 1
MARAIFVPARGAKRARFPPWVSRAIAVLLFASAWLAWHEFGGRSGDGLREATTIRPPPPGMVAVRGGTLRPGTDAATARRMFDECAATSPLRDGASLPCGPSFNGSVFARQVGGSAAGAKVKAFALDAHEVTRGEFAAWLTTQRDQTEVASDGSVRLREARHTLLAKRARTGADNEPVTEVSWYGASAYCNDHLERLPTEIEWEFAARGPSGRPYPWGDAAPSGTGFAYASSPCVADLCAAVAVGSSPGDRTPDGLFDLGGNVREWTASEFVGATEEERKACYDDDCRVVRGGSYQDAAVWLHAAIRNRFGAGQTAPTIGFRCAQGGERNGGA